MNMQINMAGVLSNLGLVPHVSWITALMSVVTLICVANPSLSRVASDGDPQNSQAKIGRQSIALRFGDLPVQMSSLAIFKHAIERKLAGLTGKFAGPAQLLAALGLRPTLNRKTVLTCGIVHVDKITHFYFRFSLFSHSQLYTTKWK